LGVPVLVSLRVVVAMALSTAVVACSSEPSGPSSPDKVEGQLRFWYVPTDPSVADWWKDFATDFESAHPGVSIEITENTVDNYQAKTLSAFAAGDEPDVIAMDTGEYLQKFVRAGDIGDLDELVDLGQVNPAAIDVLRGADGRLNGVPEYTFIISMWRNTDLFEDVDLAVPKTWADLLAACRTFNAEGITPISFGDGGQDQWTAGHIYSALLYQYGGVGADVAAVYGTDGATWSDDAYVEAAQRLVELAEADCFPSGFTGLNYSQMSALFQQGNAAMIFTGSWFGAEVGTAEFGVDVVPMPDGPGATNSTADGHGVLAGISAIVASSTAVKEKTALVTAFLEAFSAAADEYANANNLLSVAAEPNPGEETTQQNQTALLKDAQDLVVVNDVAMPAPVVDDYYQNLQALLAGQMTAEEFGAAMADAVAQEKDNLPAQ
jgi:raffinose/stachyose/melibiose transport system substrate-binding protein